MSADPRAPAIVVFDGDCALCSGWVRFLLRRDRAARYRFAAMQAASGRALLVAHGLDPDDPSSFLLLEGDRAWTDTDAIRRVVAGLGGAWRVAHVLAWIPRRLRDRIYRLVARNRYRWFGRNTQCFVPAPEHRTRFL
ncbi:MAG TPA: thiol-disulfide oxidoreductase DCC family protein [Dokdonella sp.]|nr:thiol-disulfide oxidoreductase DCC family protein [Dokdonella sp.]